MIDIQEKKACVGCGLCAAICPRQCIEMQRDGEGFLYPVVEETNCIQCDMCSEGCPSLHPGEKIDAQEIWASQAMDSQIREESSSGGVFSVLAEKVLEADGIVFGTKFNNEWEAVVGCVSEKSHLNQLRGSKYVQSSAYEQFPQVKILLEMGKVVLFSGTACQVAALRRFLGEVPQNLILVDVLCHGGPSPLLWKEYLNLICRKRKWKMQDIEHISFRNKRLGWARFGLEIKTFSGEEFFEPLNKNLFMDAFLHNLSIRPSCYECPLREGRCHSDITLGDFWGVGNHFPSLNDDKGTSLVIINSLKGKEWFGKLSLRKEKASFEQIFEKNSVLQKSVSMPKERTAFWNEFNEKGIETTARVCKRTHLPFIKRCMVSLRYRITKLFGNKKLTL